MHARNTTDGSDSSTMARPALLTVSQCAEAFALSTRSIWRLISTGELKTVKCGRSVRIVRASADQFVERGGTKS